MRGLPPLGPPWPRCSPPLYWLPSAAAWPETTHTYHYRTTSSGACCMRYKQQGVLQTCSCWKVMSLVRQTSSTVMLSQPRPPIPQSGARQSCISFSHTSLGSHPSFSASRQKSTTSCNNVNTDYWVTGEWSQTLQSVSLPRPTWLESTSQMPSQAMTRNSQSSVMFCITTSGNAGNRNASYIIATQTHGVVHPQYIKNTGDGKTP